MGDNTSLIRLDEAQALTQSLESAERSEEIGLSASGEAVGTITDEFIALIESRTFIRECIRRSMQSAFPLQIQTFSEADELQRKCHNLPNLILLSSIEERTEANADVFKILSQIAPRIPIIVLAHNNDAQMAMAAICYGAKGYIPVTLGFDIAIEAVRFVLAGGTYVPIDYLLMRTQPEDRRPTRCRHPAGSPPVSLQSCERSRTASRIKSSLMISGCVKALSRYTYVA